MRFSQHNGTAQFLLVEFNTPQLAGDNDRAIKTKLDELRQQGQTLPTGYRKVGNYQCCFQCCF